MENKINEQTNDQIDTEIVERLKGKNYKTIMAILSRAKDTIETHLTLT